jgi:DNA-binding MarR family transcriptional regulator
MVSAPLSAPQLAKDGKERLRLWLRLLSRFPLVSNGNVTGIVDRLVSEGLVLRARRNGDRRTSIVRLTRAGSDLFRTMAAAHEEWIGELLGDVSDNDTRRLTAMLKSFRSNWEGRE